METETGPSELRHLIRAGKWTTPTSGAAPGHVQANLVMLPEEEAFHFLLFCVRNPKPCPILDVLEPGEVEPGIARGADLRTDLPRSFLLGCSFSFENAMLAASLPIRNMEEGKNVSMYKTGIQCRTAGPFSAPLVVTMRPMTPAQAVRAVQVTTRFHLTHGAPIHLGAPEEIGIMDIHRPDFGDPVTTKPGEIAVFWACGVTSQLAATSAPIYRVITHAPGHMFVSDLKDEDLTLM
jgi:uncharacterized protein YcsI (UPF0317 family)